ncbi:MAG TPA: DPP IV N-terminal domain-containing protein [Terriglobia bacterium]|jgi:TolB protein|nr:DPP IV N-terminal domain-containing protein [Terriglobia bacterium]
MKELRSFRSRLPARLVWAALVGLASAIVAGSLLTSPGASAQQITVGTSSGVPRIRMAVTEFQAQSTDPKLTQLTQEFNTVLWNDLDNAGIFDLISRSFYPLKPPVAPSDVVFDQWANPPVSTQMLAYGKTEVLNSNLVFTAYLYDVKNPGNPGVLARRFVATMDEISTRETAHRWANEIIKTLGGGISGIALTKIAFVSKRTGHAEIYAMDYDGFNQHPITSYGSLSLTPRWSPDNNKLAFTSYAGGNPEILIYSLESHHLLPFPKYSGLNATPAWSPDGKKLAFCSSLSGDPEIYVSNADGSGLQRLTFSSSVDISPVWNPKTGNEIAFVSDRSGSPQVYIMNSDGSNLRRLISGGGDASEPSWSPDGQFMAFEWRVSETGTYDVYLIDIASGQITQLTHDTGRNEHPTWSPDGRHLVFESTRGGTRQVWMMLANGSDAKQLTSEGENWNPNWSN